MVVRQLKLGVWFSLHFFYPLEILEHADKTSNDGHASPAGLEVCLRCKKGVKGNEAGLES